MFAFHSLHVVNPFPLHRFTMERAYILSDWSVISRAITSTPPSSFTPWMYRCHLKIVGRRCSLLWGRISQNMKPGAREARLSISLSAHRSRFALHQIDYSQYIHCSSLAFSYRSWQRTLRLNLHSIRARGWEEGWQKRGRNRSVRAMKEKL